MPGVAEFAQNPSQFLKRNLVVQLSRFEHPETLQGSIGHFYVVPYEQVWLQKQDSTWGNIPTTRFDRSSAKVYMMKASDEFVVNSVPAYWLNYVQNRDCQVPIGTGAAYVFTPTIDGCTVGIGPHNGNGGHLLSHVNRGGFKNNDIQVQKAKEISGQDALILDSNAYQRWNPWDHEPDNTIKTTAWGERNGNDWKFFYQSFRISGGYQYTWLGLKPFPMI